MPDPQPPAEAGRVVVVLDVNIFLDVARELGEPFSWAKFEASLANNPSPSIQAVAAIRRGMLPDGSVLEVWTSDHIDRLTALKASQPTEAHDERDRGLGWSVTNAQGLIDVLVTDLIVETGGGSVGEVRISYGTPPLDHEDGCVYATVRDAGFDDIEYAERYCVTRDGQFRRAHLPGLIDVLEPHEWVLKQQALSRAQRIKNMLRPGAR